MERRHGCLLWDPAATGRLVPAIVMPVALVLIVLWLFSRM
jgi:hypothetical protein